MLIYILSVDMIVFYYTPNHARLRKSYQHILVHLLNYSYIDTSLAVCWRDVKPKAKRFIIATGFFFFSK